MMSFHKPFSRRSFMKGLGAIAGSAIIRPSQAQINAVLGERSADSAEGYIIDAQTQEGIGDVLVNLNGFSTISGPDGHYVVGATSSVPDTERELTYGMIQSLYNDRLTHAQAQSLEQRMDAIRAGKRDARVEARVMDFKNRLVREGREYVEGHLYFEPASEHWIAEADVTGEFGDIDFNAALPPNVGQRYGVELDPFVFGSAWAVYPWPFDDRLITYRTQDLPVHVGGDMDSPEDWNLVQECVDEMNSIQQKEFYVLDQTMDEPDWYLGEKGIWVLHSNGYTQTTPKVNDSDNPEYLLGSRVEFWNPDFLEGTGAKRMKELLFRSMNGHSGVYNNGIFRGSAGPITDLNREHIALLHTLQVRGEDGRNDLMAADYVRQWFARDSDPFNVRDKRVTYDRS